MKKLAISIAGAVSLGSYEAGVLFEFLDAIRQHNNNPVTKDHDRIVIDVLTGASAGGMTAIILAQKLLFEAGQFQGAYDNPLYNTWVTRISLVGLQATDNSEAASESLFSTNLLNAISREVLMQRYATPILAPAQRHAAVGEAIRLGVALTNLNGVAYGYSVTPGGRFSYVDYSDQLTRHVTAPICDTGNFWEPLCSAAVACGSFPIAFRVQDMMRSARGEPDDYTGDNLEPWDHDPTAFTYSDGGILQNQPLGMAKNLVDMIDRHTNQAERFYLFVSPHAKDPAENKNVRAANANYLHVFQWLLEIVTGQAGFQDWISAKGVNQHVSVLDARAEGLKDAILRGQIDVTSLATTAAALLNLLFLDGKHLAPGATTPETLAQAQGRIGSQYEDEMSLLVKLPGQADAFRDAVLALETAAGLGARDYMTVYGVTANAAQLAGAGLQAFLGFFDQRFRDHDYDVGRLHARQVLTDPALSQPGALGPIRFTGSAIRPIDFQLDGLKLSKVPKENLRLFKASMRNRLKQMLDELWGPYLSLAAAPVANLILESALDSLIAKL
jgi:Patatin-like phospholipase